MSKKLLVKRLALATETLRTLSGGALESVAGGQIISSAVTTRPPPRTTGPRTTSIVESQGAACTQSLFGCDRGPR